VFTAELLVWASQCQVNKDRVSCEKLRVLEVEDAQVAWLAFLALRRDTFVMPTPNCMGYLQRQRADQGQSSLPFLFHLTWCWAGVDPNRDFPYSRRDNNCLVSKTALVIDALFRNVTVQVSLADLSSLTSLPRLWSPSTGAWLPSGTSGGPCSTREAETSVQTTAHTVPLPRPLFRSLVALKANRPTVPLQSIASSTPWTAAWR
jgi:hypothetical protein